MRHGAYAVNFSYNTPFVLFIKISSIKEERKQNSRKREKIHCYLSNVYFETVNKFLITTVEIMCTIGVLLYQTLRSVKLLFQIEWEVAKWIRCTEFVVTVVLNITLCILLQRKGKKSNLVLFVFHLVLSGKKELTTYFKSN